MGEERIIHLSRRLTMHFLCVAHRVHGNWQFEIFEWLPAEFDMSQKVGIASFNYFILLDY